MDAQVRAYLDAIPAEHRALFDRLHGLVLRVAPLAEISLSYRMPAYRVGERRIFLATWRHGVSIYGWRKDDDGGFVERHPALRTSTGTIRVRPEEAASIADAEFVRLFCGTLGTAPV